MAEFRLDQHGGMDASFGVGGVAALRGPGRSETGKGVVAFGFNDSDFSYAGNVTVQDDGKIILAGYALHGLGAGSHWDMALSRHPSDGSFDSTFDSNGKVVSDFNGVLGVASEILLQPDGKLVVGGVCGGIVVPDAKAAMVVRPGCWLWRWGQGGGGDPARSVRSAPDPMLVEKRRLAAKWQNPSVWACG